MHIAFECVIDNKFEAAIARIANEAEKQASIQGLTCIVKQSIPASVQIVVDDYVLNVFKEDRPVETYGFSVRRNDLYNPEKITNDLRDWLEDFFGKIRKV